MHSFLFGLVPLMVIGAVAGSVETVVPAHLESLGALDRRDTITSVRTDAHVTVSDGRAYDAVTFFRDPQRAIFERTYPDRTITLGMEGRYLWSWDGEKQEEGPPSFEIQVLGHQFHAQLLYFDRLNGPLAEPVLRACDAAECLEYRGANGNSLLVDLVSGRPTRLVLVPDATTVVTIDFDDWRSVQGITLPFLVRVDDGNRRFAFAYRSVTFDEGSLDDHRPPAAALTDEQKLLRLHRRVMDAHLDGDAAAMNGVFGENGIVVSDGEIHPATGVEIEGLMARILTSRDYTTYDDLVRPIVRISDDGSLGWLVARVQARGVRFDESGAPTGPLEFTSAWISTFAKEGGVWKQIGNVSNFAEGRK